MKLLLSLLIITTLPSFANDRPTSKSAPNYNSTMDPANSSSTTTTTGATGYETPANDSDIVTTGASSTVRKKTTRKTLEESCEKINGKMVCDQEKRTQQIIKNTDATKDKALDIPDSDLE